MADLNVSVISGRLTKDPELRQTTSGKYTCTFTIACNRVKGKDQTETEADFIQCVAWNQTAEYLTRYGRKGDRVECHGRIQTRHYESDGRTVYVTEIIIRELSLIGGRSTAETEQKPTRSEVYSEPQIYQEPAKPARNEPQPQQIQFDGFGERAPNSGSVRLREIDTSREAVFGEDPAADDLPF